ncbi:MAG: accessory Sec system protein Asp1 [Ruminococcus flavefaciens]|nr:accessory Sec system protein Asp1 [Ruminococcus flavefaciens]
MLYFIPAWYKNNEWCENEQSWRVRRMQSEFDDTVKQIQLFHRSGVYDYQIMLLSFAPNFRHFLHRQGIYRAPYWSCFDAIQEVERKKVRVLSFHDLSWPDGIEFLYSPFVVIAMLGKKKYAQIDFGEDGNPIWIEMYRDDKICRRNLYDDRGFVSCTILYEEGVPVYQEYLTENGIWKLRCYNKDGHVEINEKCPDYLLECEGSKSRKQFSRRTYNTLEQVMYEVLTAFLELTSYSDIFCVAMHNLHAGLLARALQHEKKILSFFQDRYQISDREGEAAMIRYADYVVVDSQENAGKVRRTFQMPPGHMMAIPPYDTRVEEGTGLQSGVQKLLLAVDDLDQDSLGKIVRILARYLSKKKGVQVCLFTRDAAYNRKQKLLEMTRAELAKGGLPEEYAADAPGENVAENDLELGEKIPVLFVPEQCMDELSVSKCMREQWLLIDLREVPEQYLQIKAVSFGIPQIVRKGTEFIVDDGNGIILDHLKQLPRALEYYLNGLEHWNEARIFSYEVSRRYTTERLLDMWGEVMDSVGNDKYSADWRK